MTDNEKAEYDLLKLANENGKFGIELGTVLDFIEGKALERLLLRRWVTLIDVSPLAVTFPDPRLFRVFLASDAAMTWFRSQQ